MTTSEVSVLIAKAFSKLQTNQAHAKYTSMVSPTELLKVMLAIAKVESNYNPLAKNKNSTASGLFQILSGTKKDIETRILKITDIKDIFDAEYNTYLATAYLLYQYQRYGEDWNKAIIAYNQGSYNTSKDGQNYLAKVSSKYEAITDSGTIVKLSTSSSTSKTKRNFG